MARSGKPWSSARSNGRSLRRATTTLLTRRCSTQPAATLSSSPRYHAFQGKGPNGEDCQREREKRVP